VNMSPSQPPLERMPMEPSRSVAPPHANLQRSIRRCLVQLLPAAFALLSVGPLCAGEAKRIPLQMARVLGSGMVLQQGMPVPIWGMVTPGAEVAVSFMGQEVTVTADADGHWLARLAPLAPVPGHAAQTMTVRSGASVLSLSDILIGEVWFGAGQSNMETSPEFYRKELAASKQPPGRADLELQQMIDAGPYPQLRIFHFGRDAKGWQVADAGTLETFSAQMFAFGLAIHRARGVPVGLVVAGVGASPSGAWLNPDELARDDVYQQRMNDLLAAWKADEAANLKRMQEDHERYQNARKPAPPPTIYIPGTVAMKWRIGGIYRSHVSQVVPLAVRGVLWDQGESGCGIRGLTTHEVMAALLRGWRAAWQRPDLPFILVQKPSGGGCHAFPDTPAGRWASPFEAWRADHVGSRVEVRESEEDDLGFSDLPGVTITPVSDLGGGLHPWNKSGYGTRSAAVALGRIYGQAGAWHGPTMARCTRQGSSVRVQFSNTGTGLKAFHADTVQGFALSGDGIEFRWAEAAIDGDTVMVRCPAVASPTAIRYVGHRPFSNLFNREGLPALGFTATLTP
jgi:sialate O-acetylesterase